jgi:AAHS family 4-hydroxybenzoate transporter-like MFS transporter
VAVTLTIVSIPLGGALAGEVAALVIPSQGWRMLFAICGAVPIAVALVLWKVLPESPKFLARHPQRWTELTTLLRRCGHDVPDAALYTVATDAAPVATSRAKIAALFRGGFARDTTALWASFFFSLMVNYVVILLLPALLTSTAIGFDQPTASRALAISNYGGVAGAVLGALAMQRFGSRVAMLGMAGGAILCGAALATLPLDARQSAALLAMLLVAGAFMNGVQTTMYALAAHVYPTAIRSTGVGTAVAVGRIGNVLAAYAGSLAIDRGGASGYFTSWSVLMLVVFAALACIERHVPGRRHASSRPDRRS